MKNGLINYLKAVSFVVDQIERDYPVISPSTSGHLRDSVSQKVQQIYGSSDSEVEEVIQDALSAHVISKSMTQEEYHKKIQVVAGKK